MATVLELELIRLRRMTPAEKIAVSEALWREAWALKHSSIATQHPDWSAAQLGRATRDAMTDREKVHYFFDSGGRYVGKE